MNKILDGILKEGDFVYKKRGGEGMDIRFKKQKENTWKGNKNKNGDWRYAWDKDSKDMDIIGLDILMSALIENPVRSGI